MGKRFDSMKLVLSSLVLAGLLVGPAVGDVLPCAPAQPCTNGPPVPFPVVSPVQGLNALTNRLQQRRAQQQQPAPVVPWNYVPVATPPPYLPPDMQRPGTQR